RRDREARVGSVGNAELGVRHPVAFFEKNRVSFREKNDAAERVESDVGRKVGVDRSLELPGAGRHAAGCGDDRESQGQSEERWFLHRTILAAARRGFQLEAPAPGDARQSGRRRSRSARVIPRSARRSPRSLSKRGWRTSTTLSPRSAVSV